MKPLKKQSYMLSIETVNIKNLWKTVVILFQGFLSGLPIMLVGSTIQAWLTNRGDAYQVGLITMASLPYALKPLWAWVFDRYDFRFLGPKKCGSFCHLLLFQ